MPVLSKAEQSKLHLVKVAARLFAERGLRGVTARDIAAAAGVSHSMIFRYFGSLEDLAKAAFEHLSAQIGQSSRVLEPFPDQADIQDLFDRLAEAEDWVRLMAHGLMEPDIQFGDPDHLAFKRIVASLDRAQAAGRIRADLDSHLLALSLCSVALGWLLTENRVADLLCDPALDIRAYRHRALAMWIELVGT